MRPERRGGDTNVGESTNQLQTVLEFECENQRSTYRLHRCGVQRADVLDRASLRYGLNVIEVHERLAAQVRLQSNQITLHTARRFAQRTS
jgi:hypothetical protein